MTLREATRHILDSEEPAKWLELADMYIKSYKQLPDVFVIPADHAILQPVVAGFHADTEAFVEYIKAIRDMTQPGDERIKLHDLYRTIITRRVMGVRRQRVQTALRAVERAINRPLDPDEAARVGTKLEQYWARRRRELLKNHRSKTVKGRLSTSVQNSLLKEFWAEIDAEIERGELPIFNI